MNLNQQKNFEELINEIDKKYGKGTFASKIDSKIESISSGSLLLDNILPNKGFPKGRIIEIYGNESSGKTTIALQTIKECLSNGGKAVYIDVENALDINYVESIGINPEKLLIARPESGEQTFSIIDALVKTNLIDLIVVDSVAAMISESELKGEVVDQSIGTHARLMSKGLRMIQNVVSKNNVCIIFINQVREKVGVIFGNPEITTGGKALKFFSSLRIDVRKAELLKDNNDVIGIKSKVNIVKNKLGPPLRHCFVDIFFGKGFSYKNEIIDFAIQYEIIKKSGNWFYYNDNKICQGKKQLSNYMDQNDEFYQEIKMRVIKFNS